MVHKRENELLKQSKQYDKPMIARQTLNNLRKCINFKPFCEQPLYILQQPVQVTNYTQSSRLKWFYSAFSGNPLLLGKFYT